jgi:putative spermidine/putrescine transport system substrate-binding protein
MSVVLMDDPVMILAEDEQLIERLAPANVPNVAEIKPAARPRDAMWANYMQPRSSVAYNSDLVKGGLASYADMWDPKWKGKLILPSLQSTEGLWALLAAAQLETGKPFAEALKEIDSGFQRLKSLRSNVMMIYNQSSQAMQLLETGEASLVSGIDSRGILFRKSQGAPIDLSKPKEGSFAMPAGIARVKGGPNPELSYALINEFLGVELQSLFAATFFSNPTHPKATLPAGYDTGGELFVPDWEYVTRNRKAWIDRWEREISRG